MTYPYIITRNNAGKTGRLKHKWDATTAPTTGDDDADGYDVGSLWIDTTGPAVYVCADATTAAAVWVELSGVGSIDWGEDADITTLDYDDVADAGVLDEAARADHVHGMPAEPVTGGAAGQLLISDSASSPVVFGDILQNETQTDFLYEG